MSAAGRADPDDGRAANGPAGEPRVLVFSSLFPNASAPTAGVFIRERMFRVAKRMPLVVVAPQAWSPFDWAIRLLRPGFRPQGAAFEVMDGIEVHRPRALSFPGVLKRLDGRLMALSTIGCVRRIHRRFRATVIDAHFAYPDGFAAVTIGRRLGLPVTLSVRGSKDQMLLGTDREPALRETLHGAAQLIAVTESLVSGVGGPLGLPPERFTVVGNGVDLSRFEPMDRAAARARLGIAEDAKVIIGVGNLIPLKGFQRIIPLLPRLRRRHPKLVYLIVGGGGTQGDNSQQLAALAKQHGVADCVRLCGRQMPDDLKWYYSAADVFALATEFEGWANVFLEAMACGLPVVTTRVGGNPEVITSEAVGTLVDYWDDDAFAQALEQAFDRRWDTNRILAYARANDWVHRIDQLEAIFRSLGETSPVKAA